MLVVLLTVLTAVAAVYAVFFLPLHIGVVPVPISALIVAAVVFAAVRLCYSLTGSVLAAAAPAAAWLIVSVVLGTTRHPRLSAGDQRLARADPVRPRRAGRDSGGRHVPPGSDPVGGRVILETTWRAVEATLPGQHRTRPARVHRTTDQRPAVVWR